MITYKRDDVDVIVHLDGKRVGTIRMVLNGYRYFPEGKSKGGELFPTLSAAKESLESE